MSAPRAIVLRAAGTNCDQETVWALEKAGARAERLHVNRLLESPDPFAGIDLLVIPGGFTYGDDLGAGRILGVKLEHKLKGSIEALVARGGLVLGICNGFQALVRAGLLPGGGRRATLTKNVSGKFEARWIRLKADAARSPWTLAGELLDMPTAHGEGRLVLESPGELAALEQAGQVAFRYVEPEGGAPGVAGDAGRSPAAYPANPSGSPGDVAGLVDPTGRILGLMPHPERNVEPWHRPGWQRDTGRGASGPGVGLRVFARAVEALKG